MKQLTKAIVERALQAELAVQAQWLNGYQVVIAKVVSAFGDGRIPHPLGHLTPLAKV